VIDRINCLACLHFVTKACATIRTLNSSSRWRWSARRATPECWSCRWWAA